MSVRNPSGGLQREESPEALPQAGSGDVLQQTHASNPQEPASMGPEQPRSAKKRA